MEPKKYSHKQIMKWNKLKTKSTFQFVLITSILQLIQSENVHNGYPKESNAYFKNEKLVQVGLSVVLVKFRFSMKAKKF